MVLIINLERELNVRDLQHELELALLEERLAEHKGLRTELDIRREADLFRALKGFNLLGLEGWGYGEPPRMRRVMPRATTDWDFAYATWNLDASVYHSAPSSLIPENAGNVHQSILCKYAGTHPLDQGRIVTWMRLQTSISTLTVGGWRFRSMPGPGSASGTADAYIFLEKYDGATRDNSKATLAFMSGGGYSTFQTNSYLANGEPPFDTWDHRRITWWVSAGVMIFRCERYYGGAWIKAIDDIPDAANRFTGNAFRRCGVGSRVRGNHWDDTEIWGP